MSLDFQSIHHQVRQLGQEAPARARDFISKHAEARKLLWGYSNQLAYLHQIVEDGLRQDRYLRCAQPTTEPLTTAIPTPIAPNHGTILAADGSQINPDRHAAVEYCLVNVGAIQLQLNSDLPPTTTIRSELIFHDQLNTPFGKLTDGMLALKRDMEERAILAELAQGLPPMVVTFTDGPMELWATRDTASQSAFSGNLDAYLAVLSRLHQMEVVTAGYVDKPQAGLVVRMLELVYLDDTQPDQPTGTRPFQALTDRDIFQDLLLPGERSAVFAFQSRSSQSYRDELALHFFYLNVGRPQKHWVTRVEIPRWVAESQPMLDSLHAVLVSQCQIMGNRPYPYLLHRAHEAAVVSLDEKRQLEGMIAAEIHRHGLQTGEISYKQVMKDLPGKTRYQR